MSLVWKKKFLIIPQTVLTWAEFNTWIYGAKKPELPSFRHSFTFVMIIDLRARCGEYNTKWE